MEITPVDKRVSPLGTRGPSKGAGRPLLSRSAADRLALSRQAVVYLEEQSRRAEAVRSRERPGSGESGLLDALSKASRAMDLCHKIAARLMAGDKVPLEDLRYLMQNDPEGYKLAMASRREKPDPRAWESALTQEDKASKEMFRITDLSRGSPGMGPAGAHGAG